MIHMKNWVCSHLLLLSGIRLSLGMGMVSLIHLPALTVWFGDDRSPCNAWNTAPQETSVATWSLSWSLLISVDKVPLGGLQDISKVVRLVIWSFPRFWESGTWSQVIGIACPFHAPLWALGCHMADTNYSTSLVLNLVDLSYESSYLNDRNPSRAGAKLLMSVPFLVCHGEDKRRSRNDSLQ